MPSGRNCILFEWQRCSRVLQAQCRMQWQRVKKPFSDSVARVYWLGKHSIPKRSRWADEDCRRLDGAVGVTRPSLTDCQIQKRSSADSAFQSVVCLKLKERQTMHLQFCVPGPRFVWFSPATDGQVGATTLGCHITWQPLQVWRRDATTFTVFMPDDAVSGELLDDEGQVRTGLGPLEKQVVLDSIGCWHLQHKERAIPTLALEDTNARRSSWEERWKRQVRRHSLERWCRKPDDVVKQFSVVRFGSRRAYFQCLLVLPRIWELGVRRARSNDCIIFFFFSNFRSRTRLSSPLWVRRAPQKQCWATRQIWPGATRCRHHGCGANPERPDSERLAPGEDLHSLLR